MLLLWSIPIFCVATATTAVAEEIARCGPSTGKSFYAADPVLNIPRDNFSDDRLGEQIVLTRSSDGQFDLDLGGGRTALTNDGRIYVFRFQSEILVYVMWPGHLQTFVFTLEGGNPILMWTRKRANGFKSVGAYMAPCDFVKFSDEGEFWSSWQLRGPKAAR